jgi:hypothetical protein
VTTVNDSAGLEAHHESRNDMSGEREMITTASKSAAKKLSLKRESLRELSTTDLNKVVGGGTTKDQPNPLTIIFRTLPI